MKEEKLTLNTRDTVTDFTVIDTDKLCPFTKVNVYGHG